MTLWKRRLIPVGIVAILLIGMYQKMAAIGWSHRVMAICYGGLSLAIGLMGFCMKRDTKFAELMGRNFSARGVAIENTVFALVGAGLLAWAFF